MVMFFWSWYSLSRKIKWPSQWFTFLTERMKNEKVEELTANLHDKKEYVIDIRYLRQALNHGSALKNFEKLELKHIVVWMHT